MKTLKEEIKGLVAEQKVCKNQRKTVRIQGERTMDVWKAHCTHASNRNHLRYLYMAYGIMRGRTPEQVDKNHMNISMMSVEKIIAEFTIPTVKEEAA